MKIWVDAQLSPFIALWLNQNFPELDAKSMRSLGLRDSSDFEIFQRARIEDAVILSKDYDFVKLYEQNDTPPRLIWITAGNTSNARMCEILKVSLQQALDLLASGEKIVEISSK
jgi:predicted nuclease of predicted toxin-antitoxin system